MKSHEVYNTWKKRKTQIDIRGNFAESVMNRIYHSEQQKGKSWFDLQRFINIVSANPLAQAGMVVTGVIIGFIRLAFVVGVFLK